MLHNHLCSEGKMNLYVKELMDIIDINIIRKAKIEYLLIIICKLQQFLKNQSISLLPLVLK